MPYGATWLDGAMEMSPHHMETPGSIWLYKVLSHAPLARPSARALLNFLQKKYQQVSTKPGYMYVYFSGQYVSKHR